MTAVALPTVSPLVVVFAAVTVYATVLEYVFEVRLAVTVIALQPGVRVLERKTCLGMIESDAAPRGGRVAVLACTAVCAGVHVIHCMAAGTARRGPRKLVIPMTVNAGNKTVVSCQAIARRIMVEVGLLPVRVDVAAVALLAQPACVRVIFCVASVTGIRRVSKCLIGGVTVGAAGAAMRAGQNKIGPAMVEDAGFSRSYVGVPTFMVCVAGYTVVSLRGRESTVQTVLGMAVVADVFVATRAKCGACLIGLGVVTGAAV